MLGNIANPALQGTAPAVSAPATQAGATGEAGVMRTQKDQKESSTDPKFGDILNSIQAKYGAKPKEQRQIKKTLDKDDFLKIMITQMKHQDPTAPFKADQMATQMAQFASVEQLQNVNQNLKAMTEAGKPLERMAMTNMIGKTVTVDRERFPHTQGQNEALSFALPKDATEVHVMLVSDAGETVYSKDMGPQKAGSVEFNWDGKKENTLPAKSGTYMLRVEAKNEKGQVIMTNPQSQARVIGISFEGSEPVFLVGDSKHQDKVTMRNIVRVDDAGVLGGPPSSFGAATPMGGMPGAPGGAAPRNFIAFQKGEGSTNLDSANLSPEAQEAIAKYQASQAAQEGGDGAKSEASAAKPAAPAGHGADLSANPVAAPLGRPGEQGFPNGLHDETSPGNKTAGVN